MDGEPVAASGQAAGEFAVLADTAAIALLTGRKPGTIRSWASKGWLRRMGTDARGRALYSLAEAEALDRRLADPAD